MKRIFLIHGWRGRPDNHWFPYVSWELKARGFEVLAPHMPSADKPQVSEWLHFLKDYVGKPDQDTYFIGHSLGCFAVARYLEALTVKRKAGGCVFVAGFSDKLAIPELASFFPIPFDSEKAKAHCGKFTCIFSDTDECVPLETALAFARELGAKIILERGKGHFTAEEGVTALPSALDVLLKMSA